MSTPNPVLTGYLDKTGHPRIKLKVQGVAPQLAQEFEAMIDTGFTGFLLMPIILAFPLGLILYGTSNYVLADNSTSAKLLASGTVIIGGEETDGLIVLESAQCDLLLGMDYLRKAKKSLMVSPTKGCFLANED